MTIEPDLSKRPFALTVERKLEAPISAHYRAWTEDFDKWFAEPGTLTMEARVDAPFFFETRYEAQRHPHYGRFLELVPDELVRLTWVTGNPGTAGAETVVTVRFAATGDGATLEFSHAGFYDRKTCDGHRGAWQQILGDLDRKLSQDTG